jgi:hypothetical protein
MAELRSVLEAGRDRVVDRLPDTGALALPCRPMG